jgi:chromosome segregation ATPase
MVPPKRKDSLKNISTTPKANPLRKSNTMMPPLSKGKRDSIENGSLGVEGFATGKEISKAIGVQKEQNRARVISLETQVQEMQEMIDSQTTRLEEYETEVVPGYKNAIESINETVSSQENEILSLKETLMESNEKIFLLGGENVRLQADLELLRSENSALQVNYDNAEVAKPRDDVEKDHLMLMLIQDHKNKLNNIGI